MTARKAERDTHVEPGAPEPLLVYDGACPFCRAYVRQPRFTTRAGQRLRLVDGREAPELVDRMRRGGCDLDEGMILVDGDRRYHGAAAMTRLEAMATGSGRLDRLARWLASNPARARRLYPWLRRLRAVALWVKRTPGFGV